MHCRKYASIILTKPLLFIWIYLLGLITDKVKQAGEIRRKLSERTDLQRMIDWIMAIVS